MNHSKMITMLSRYMSQGIDISSPHDPDTTLTIGDVAIGITSGTLVAITLQKGGLEPMTIPLEDAEVLPPYPYPKSQYFQ